MMMPSSGPARWSSARGVKRVDAFDDIERHLVEGRLSGALSALDDALKQPALPIARLTAIVGPIAHLIAPGISFTTIRSLVQQIGSAGKQLTVLESASAFALLHECAKHAPPPMLAPLLHAFAPVLALCTAAIAPQRPVLRQLLFPLVQQYSRDVQCAAIHCVGRLYVAPSARDNAVLNDAPDELDLLLSVLPELVTFAGKDAHGPRCVIEALVCLQAIIPHAADAVRHSITSILFVLRKLMVFEGTGDRRSSKFRPSSAGSDAGCIDDGVLRQAVEIRVLALHCIQLSARNVPSLFSTQWAALVPSSTPSLRLRRPFGGHTLLTVMQFDQSARVRSAAANALMVMIENSPVPVISLGSHAAGGSTSASTAPSPLLHSAAFTSSSLISHDIVNCLHLGLLYCITTPHEDGALNIILQTISSLATRTPYQQLPDAARHLAPILSRLIELLQSNSAFHLGRRHEVFSCLAAVLAAPSTEPQPLLDTLIPLLIADHFNNVRPPPNAVTVLSRIARRHSTALCAHWGDGLEAMLTSALGHGLEHIRLSAMLVMEEWLKATPTVLSLPGASQLVINHLAVACFDVPVVAVRSRSLLTLSHITRDSWHNELNDMDRAALLTFLVTRVCVTSPAHTTTVRAAACRAVGAIAAHDTGTVLLEPALLLLISSCGPEHSLALRTRAHWGIANILDQPDSANHCRTTLAQLAPAIVREIELGLDAHSNIALSAVRSCAQAVWRGGTHSSPALADSTQWPTLIAPLAALLASEETPMKLRWNVCRTFGSFVAAVGAGASGDSLATIVACLSSIIATCSNDKVRLAAIGAFAGINPVDTLPGDLLELLARALCEARSSGSVDLRAAVYGTAASLCRRPLRPAVAAMFRDRFRSEFARSIRADPTAAATQPIRLALALLDQ